MLTCRADMERLTILSDLHHVDDGFFAPLVGALFLNQLDDSVVVSIHEVVAILVDSRAFLEVFVHDERINIGKWILFEAHQAAVDHIRLLHDGRENIVAVVTRAESHLCSSPSILIMKAFNFVFI